MTDNPKSVLKVGTRTSALATTQSEWFADQLRKAYPGLEIQMVGIKVAADEGLNTALSQKPLWQLDEKNVFTKELDEALLDGRTDCSIHSFKDLSTERPEGIAIGAVPGREIPHDIVLFHPRVTNKLKSGQAIIIGTSAPRRMTNVAPFLTRALPKLSGQETTIEIKPIRGNVDSRIRRMFEDESSERYVDGVVLALAGISRLYNNNLLRDTLPQLRKMLLPLTYCPAAPAQGALAIECRSEDENTLQLLQNLNDKAVWFHIQKEREQLLIHGGGCHQKFGATSVPHPRFENGLMYIHGETADGKNLNDLVWDQPAKPQTPIVAFDGMARRAQNHQDMETIPAIKSKAVFISHARASSAALDQLQDQRIWTSGAESWLTMAEKGLWVEGCGDGLGIEFLRRVFATPCLELPEWQDWIVLTNDEAKDGWKESSVIGTYKLGTEILPVIIDEIQQATHIFWGSSFQFDQYRNYVPSGVHHACGAGKTADHLEQQSLNNFDVFPNRKEWQKWISR